MSLLGYYITFLYKYFIKKKKRVQSKEKKKSLNMSNKDSRKIIFLKKEGRFNVSLKKKSFYKFFLICVWLEVGKVEG